MKPRAFAASLVAGLVAVCLLIGPAVASAAHPRGTLRIPSKTLRAGDSLAVTGSQFEPKDAVTLVLIGVTGRKTLADIPTDEKGGFQRSILIPGVTAAGQYRLVAESVDGDEVATLDVSITSDSTARGVAMPPMPGMEHMPGHEGMAMGPNGAALTLVRARNPVVTAAAIVVIIASALAGLGLISSTRAHHPMEDTQ